MKQNHIKYVDLFQIVVVGIHTFARRARKFKKVQAKKLVKSIFFLREIAFLAV